MLQRERDHARAEAERLARSRESTKAILAAHAAQRAAQAEQEDDRADARKAEHAVKRGEMFRLVAECIAAGYVSGHIKDDPTDLIDGLDMAEQIRARHLCTWTEEDVQKIEDTLRGLVARRTFGVPIRMAAWSGQGARPPFRRTRAPR